MDPFDLADLPNLVDDLAALITAEALPVDVIPVVQATTWMTRLLLFFAKYALILAFAGAMVENTIFLGFLLPGGTVVALAAAGARNAGLSLPLVILLSAAGMTAGAMVDYLLGRAGLDRLLHHRWAGKFGQKLSEQLQQATPLLTHHGWWMMLVVHAFGHGRSALALAAGASRFGARRYILLEFPAAFLWALVYAGGGYVLGSEWERFELAMRRAGWAGGAVFLLVAGGFGVWRYVQSRRAQRPPAASGLTATPVPASVPSGSGTPSSPASPAAGL